jgi:class 3 adenylate cyclase/predicted ATPase
MRCSKCGAENREGRKFCAKCAASLARLCPQCGAANEPGEDFCGECAAALVQPPAAISKNRPNPLVKVIETPTPETLEGERKTVTALFADIKGSTELMEDLDPEEARAIIDPALRLMIEAVQRYEGYVVQSTGDGIFALFGAPVAHEDHPQRALYAALRMQEDLRHYGGKLQAEGRAPIEIRVGVSTGEVVVRSIATGAAKLEYTPIGHTTNLASRLQSLARTGSIVVSEATRKLCEGYFVLKPLGATRVKGVGEPVEVYEATGFGPLRTRLQRAVGRGLTKFVGRLREMDALKRALELAKSGHGQVVAAMAEPGVGKSRLFHEFKAASQSGSMVLEALSASYGKASAYLPVIDLLLSYFRIASDDDLRTRRERVTGRVVALERDLEDTLPFLFSLLGIIEGDDPLAQMDGQIKKRRTLEAIKRIVLRESLNQPLIIIFEDLHWIDQQTQEFLNLLVDSVGPAKILLLVNYRPEYSHQWSSKTYYTQLRLDPLGHESAEGMLSALLSDGEELVALRRFVIERTEGNPFFIEEMVQTLFDEGALTRNGVVKLTRPLNELKIPSTVQAILASRIDRLPSDAKELLQTLAVLGRQFELRLLQSVTQKPHKELEVVLAKLQAGEFIYEQPARRDIEYVFKHALTQEVTYNSVLIERRRKLHEQAAAAMESLYADRLEDCLSELARHYGHSRNTRKALEYISLAGEQAVRLAAYSEAIAYFLSALELLDSLPNDAARLQLEFPLRMALGAIFMATEGFANGRAEAAYERALEICRASDNNAQLFRSLRGLWLVRLARGELATAREIAEQLLNLAEAQRDPGLFVEAHYATGFTIFFLGELAQACAHLERSISLYDPSNHRSHTVMFGFDPKIACLADLAVALCISGYPDSGLAKAREALVIARGVQHPYNLAMALLWMSWVFVCRREGEAALEFADATAEVAAAHGFPGFMAMTRIMRGGALLERGESEQGNGSLREGLAAYTATGTNAGQVFGLTVLATSCLKLGSTDRAATALAEAFTRVDQAGEHYYEAEMYRVKGELLLKQDGSDAERARDCFEKATAIARTQGAKSLELRATMSLARLLRDTGRRDEAHAMLAEIYNWFTEGFDTADLIDASALLDELSP